MTETSIGRTKITNFDNNPTTETPVVDPYKPVELNKLNSAKKATTSSTSSIEGKVSPEQVEELKADEEYQDQLEKEGLTLDQKATKLESDLPFGLTLKDMEKAGIKVKDLDRDLSRLKDRLTGNGQSGGDSTNKPNLLITSLKYMQKASKVVDIKSYSSLVKKSKEYGFSFTDGITESSLTLGVVDGLLGSMSKSDIWPYIANTPLGDFAQGFIIDEALELSAKKGSYTSVKSIIQNYSGQVSMEKRKKCIKWLFKGFRIKDEDFDEGYTAVAKNVVSHFDYIYPHWEKYIVSLGSNDHTPITSGNDGILDLLSCHMNSLTPTISNDGVDSRKINIASVIQKDRRYVVEIMEEALSKAQPNVIQNS